MNSPLAIGEWRAEGPECEAELDMLAEVLHAAVHDGASVSFVLPFSIGEGGGSGATKCFPG